MLGTLGSTDDGCVRTVSGSEPASGQTSTTRPRSSLRALCHHEVPPYERVMKVPSRPAGVVRDLVAQFIDRRELALAAQPVKKPDANQLAIERSVKVE